MNRVALSSLLVVASFGCGKSAAPSCETAVKHVAKLAEMDDPERIAGGIAECKSEAWSEKIRSCLAKAKDRSDVDACDEPKGNDEPKSKRSEAEVNLDAIKKGLKAYYVENAAFPVGSAGLTPADPCCDSGRKDRKCEVDPTLWQGSDAEPSVWDQLSFTVDDPHYFQYSYEGTADSATVTAEGDLDCDGSPVTYTLDAQSNEGNPTFTLAKPARAD